MKLFSMKSHERDDGTHNSRLADHVSKVTVEKDLDTAGQILEQCGKHADVKVKK